MAVGTNGEFTLYNSSVKTLEGCVAHVKVELFRIYVAHPFVVMEVNPCLSCDGEVLMPLFVLTPFVGIILYYKFRE